MRRARRTAPAIALVAGLATLAAGTPPAASARGAEIRSPAANAVITASRIPVSVRLPKGARDVLVALDHHRITSRLRRVGERRLVGRVPAKLVGPGGHHLLVSHASRSGDRDSVGRKLVVAGKRRKLISVGRPRDPVPGVARLRLRAPRADRWRVKLNGRDVSHRFRGPADKLAPGRLSASVGLRHGRNRVVVSAARGDGAYDVRRFAVEVAADAPIPDAGRHRVVAADAPVRLDGRRAVASRSDTELEHRWTLVSKPRGSEAKLRGRGSARPRLHPDVRGRYRIAHVVAERTAGGALVAESAPDVVEVAAGPGYVPAIGMPIETMATEAPGARGVRIGSEFYRRTAPFQVLGIDPKTLAVTNFNFQRPRKAIDQIVFDTRCKHGQTSDCVRHPFANGTIVVVQGIDLGRWAATKGAALRVLGTPNGWLAEAGGLSSKAGFTIIGIKGAPVGSGWVNATNGSLDNPTVGAIDGFLAPNSSSTAGKPGAATYTFTPSSYIAFDTNLTQAGEGATTVEAQLATCLPPTVPCEDDELRITLSGAVDSGQSGFLVVALDAGTLKVLDSTQFAVNDPSDPNGAVEAQTQMASWLSRWSSDPSVLVLVQSIGAVTAPATLSPTGGWGPLGEQIGLLGGRVPIFNSLDGDGYSLIGGAALDGSAVAETSTELYRGQPVGTRLAGVLSLGHRGRLYPSMTTPVADADEPPNIYVPVATYNRPPQAFPYSDDKRRAAAGAWISKHLCAPGCRVGGTYNLRFLYAQPTYDFANLLADWKANHYDQPFECAAGKFGGVRFGAGECQTMLDQYGLEWELIQGVNGYFDTDTVNLQTPLIEAWAGSDSSLSNIGQSIEQSFTKLVKPPSNFLSDFLQIIQGVAILGEAVDGPVGIIGSIIDSVLNMAVPFATSSDGSNLLAQVTADVEDASAEMATWFQNAQTGLDTVQSLITTDWDKLQWFNDQLDGKNPAFDLPSDMTDMTKVLEYAARQVFYLGFLHAASWTGGPLNDGYVHGVRNSISINEAAQKYQPEQLVDYRCHSNFSPFWQFISPKTNQPIMSFFQSNAWSADAPVANGEPVYLDYHVLTTADDWVEAPPGGGWPPFPTDLAAQITAQPGVNDPKDLNGGVPLMLMFDSFRVRRLPPCSD